MRKILLVGGKGVVIGSHSDPSDSACIDPRRNPRNFVRVGKEKIVASASGRSKTVFVSAIV